MWESLSAAVVRQDERVNSVVQVVEPRMPDTVRRPSDLVRLIYAVLLLVAVIAIGDVAVGTADALEGDLFSATGVIPSVLLTLLGLASGVGVIVLPIAMGADLIWRGRMTQLLHAVLASAVCAGLVIGLVALILDGRFGTVLSALTRATHGGRSAPIDSVVSVLATYLTVCRVKGRRWHQWVAFVVLGSTMLIAFLDGTTTALALAVSVLLGWAVGLGFRFGFGAATTLPSGFIVAERLAETGVHLSRLELIDPNEDGDRRYRGRTVGGRDVDVFVIDRDTFGLAAVRGLLRRLRLRSAFTRMPALTVRAEVEHRTLVSLAYERLGVPAPRIVAACPAGAFSAVLALEPVTGRELSEATSVTDAELASVWHMLHRLHDARIAHRGLEPGVILIGEALVGGAGLVELGNGDIVAEDLTLRLDIAQLLVTVGLAVGPERAVDSAVAVLGLDHLVRTLPVLQKVALGARTRTALNRHKGLLEALQKRIEDLEPGDEVPEPFEVRRVTMRSIIAVVGGGIAAYLLLGQLAKVDVVALVREAKWGWALACLGCAVLTFAGPSLSIVGAVEAKLSFVKTYMTQLAVAFSGLVAPAAVGNIALNTRYLVRAGITPAVAGASVGLVQVAQFCSYFLLIVLSGVVAGTGTSASFTPPPMLVAAIPVVVLVIGALFAIPRVRAFVKARLVPQLRTVLPQILRVIQRPSKLAMMITGSLLLDVAFVAALVCATKAFGAEAPLAGIAVVYFAGAIVGSAVPTPGGIGGIEAAISAGLVALGMDSGVAVSSVLLYRFATYWIPIPFGWVALSRLQATGDI